MKVVAKKIEMIAYFEEDGKIKPIRFRFKEDDEYKASSCTLQYHT